jgi:WD40 repeat protein
VTFSPDGRRIVSGSADKTLKVWDARNGQEILSLQGHTGGIHSVAISPDGRHIVSGSEDGKLRVWASRAGQEVLCLEGHTEEVRCVAISPDGRRIFSVSYSTLKVWDILKSLGPKPRDD